MNCDHEEFAAQCRVTRLLDTGQFRFEATVKCSVCDEAFRFLNAPSGILLSQPCVNIDGLEISCAIEPEGDKRLFARCSVYFPKTPEKV